MDAKEETLNMLSKIWIKLQGLPNAHPIELGAFFILLSFILVVTLMSVLTCASSCCCCCCCCRRGRTKLKEMSI